MDPSITIPELLKKDESSAFRLLFDRYYDNLLLYSYHLLGDLGAAEDIVQECFVNLWNSRRLDSFTGDLDRFIFRIVKNRSLLFLKENQKKQKVYHSFSKENGDGVWYDTTEEYQEEMELLYTTIDKLPEKCRQVFLMACLNDKTYQEIADELDISINTVKSQVKTAFKFLREHLSAKAFFLVVTFFPRKMQ